MDQDRLAPDLLNLAVIIIFVILFVRTSLAAQRSRFLRHLAAAYALIGLYYLSSIALAQYSLVASYVAKCSGQPSARGLAQLNDVQELIKIMFSSLSSCFLLMTWYLLNQYPRQGISKKFYGPLFGAYFTGIPFFFGLAAVDIIPVGKVPLLNRVDSAFAMAAVGMVGWGFLRLIRIQKKWSKVVKELAVVSVSLTFLFWSLPQIGYGIWNGNAFWYILMGGKVAAGLAALLVSVSILDSKPEFESAPATAP